MIPQDPCLFKGTLKYNIDPTGEASDSTIESLVQKAGLPDLLTSFDSSKNILDYEVKEAGGNLSSGERQLICICRAVLRQAKVIVLDEATSNIDVRTEQRILDLMNSELQSSTVITIAHRLNTIIKSDRVAVLGDGKLLEYASPKELVSRADSHFAHLL